MGTRWSALPYLLRRQLGRVGRVRGRGVARRRADATCTSRASPARTSTSRASRSALIVVVFRFLDRPRRRQPALIGALLALTFATKETTFITGFVGLHVPPRGAGRRRRRRGARARALRRRERLGVGARHVRRRVHACCSRRSSPTPPGCGTASTTAWTTGSASTTSAAAASRGTSTSWSCSAMEWPVLLLGAVGSLVALRHPTLLRVFLVWAFALSLAVYSWAGERFAWLVLHPLLPLLLLAGLGVQAVWDRPRAVRRSGCAAAVARVAYVGLRVVARSTPSTAPTRASCSSRRSPPRRSSDGRRPGASRRPSRERERPPLRSPSTPPRARRSRRRGTSATSRSATSTWRRRGDAAATPTR